MTLDRDSALDPQAVLGGNVLALRGGTAIVPVRVPDAKTAAGYVRLTSHLLVRAKQRPFRSIGVISAYEGEGKTTTALNLAACLGRTQGRVGRVLLVDGDVQSRTLTQLLARVTENATPSGGGMPPRLRLTDFEGVDLMTAPGDGDDVSLCSPTMWTHLLASLPDRYSTLVVDCPSILDRPDGLVLPACVEELVLVVRAGWTTKRTVTSALEAIGRGVLGVVVNAARDR